VDPVGSAPNNPPFGPMGEIAVNDARMVFSDAGLRCTRQRELIYHALRSTKSHPTAEELFSLVRDFHDGRHLSLATVYNTLEALTACGLARRLSTSGGPNRYDAVCEDHVHVALPDGQILDVPEDASRRILDAIPRDALDRIEAEMGVRVTGVSINVQAAHPPR